MHVWQIIPKTLNPIWGETLSLSGNLQEFMLSGVTLKVFDHDSITKDDSLGTLHVKLDFLKQKDVAIFDEKLPTRGTLRFIVSRWHRLIAPPDPSLDRLIG